MSDRMPSFRQEQPELRRLWSDPRRLVVLMALRRAGGPLDEEQAADPSLLVEVNGRSILAAWAQAMRLLQGEFSPGSYQAYLAEVRPRIWEATGRLVVAPAPYVRDWLRERVGKTLVRMLCGILAQPVSILFECEFC